MEQLIKNTNVSYSYLKSFDSGSGELQFVLVHCEVNCIRRLVEFHRTCLNKYFILYAVKTERGICMNGDDFYRHFICFRPHEIDGALDLRALHLGQERLPVKLEDFSECHGILGVRV